VRRLRNAGAIVVATTNLVEIALGIHGENPWTGDVRNPRDSRRQAGGSSSGSAVAVAVGIVESRRPHRVGVPRRFLAGRLGTAVRVPFEALLDELATTPGVELVDVAPAGLELAERA
jgi:Amidase